MNPTRFHLQQVAPVAVEGKRDVEPRPYHRTFPGYRQSSLTSLPRLATQLGVAEVLVKDESERFGLPSFKILGGSWAVNRLIWQLRGESPQGRTFDDLHAAAAELGEATLVTATDGNHGRGIARMARLLGLAAHVMVPNDMVAFRREAIASEGAAVEIIDGDYDVAVRAAANYASASADRHLVADVALTDTDHVPRWVMDGYHTILDEIGEQIDGRPDAIFIQAGVGALAGAAIDYYARRAPDVRAAVVEPLTAACLFESAVAGTSVSLDESQGSMMAGLNCGTPSSVAWPLTAGRATAFIAIDDELAGDAMRLLADAGIVAGESGAAGIAGLIAAARDDETREVLGLDEHARVLTINTEGVTDPENYRRIVGAKADELLEESPNG